MRPDLSSMPIDEYQGLRALRENKSIKNVEMGIAKPDKITWVLATANPINAKGFGVILTYFDITERIARDKEQNVFNRNFKALLEQSSDLIFFKDREDKFQFCSQSVANISGHKHWSELIGKKTLDIFESEISKQYIKEDQKVLSEGIALSNIINTYVTCKGKKGFLETNKWPLFDHNNNTIGVFGVSRDITKRMASEAKVKEKEKELRKSNATKDKLFSIISHDLRSPFIGLASMNELISDSINSQDYDSAKEILSLVEKTSLKALNLLDNLLHWSRIQRGKITFNPIDLNALTIVEEVVGLFNANLEEKNIEVSLSIDPELHITADAFMLQTIVRNLLSNAIKFTNNGGKIKIAVSSNSSECQFNVLDSGIGIPEENINHLFDLNRSITTYGTNNEKGSGLGLVLCKEFVKQHKGKIWAQNNPDLGAEFIFTLKK